MTTLRRLSIVLCLPIVRDFWALPRHVRKGLWLPKRLRSIAT
jgi:hypothetical protein